MRYWKLNDEDTMKLSEQMKLTLLRLMQEQQEQQDQQRSLREQDWTTLPLSQRLMSLEVAQRISVAWAALRLLGYLANDPAQSNGRCEMLTPAGRLAETARTA